MNLISLTNRPSKPFPTKRIRLNPDRKLLSVMHVRTLRAFATQFHSVVSRSL
jgi:hypothetical protein